MADAAANAARDAMAVRLAGWCASLGAAVRGRRLAILMYHRVLPAADPLVPDAPDAATFELEISALAERFRPLALEDAAGALASGTLPPRAVCITFDDGYADNATVALPILRKWRVPATFFISTGYLNGGRMFNDTVVEAVRRLPGDAYDAGWLGLGPLPLRDTVERSAAIGALLGAIKYLPGRERTDAVDRLAAAAATPLPTNLMMTSTQVRELAAVGMSLGGHTRRHPILARVDPDTARDEIGGGREELAALVRRPVPLFAYPNGRPTRDYGPEHVQMVREAGFTTAVSTAWAAATRSSDPLQLPRIAPPPGSQGRFALRVAKSFLDG